MPVNDIGQRVLYCETKFSVKMSRLVLVNPGWILPVDEFGASLRLY